jgi:3',5'-cyclic AMP phosphodiesterase CpdA
MSICLAHFSDLHLGPVSAADVFGSFKLKRLIGGVSWHARRKALHLNSIADALRADVTSSAIDHIAVTGDLVNLAAPAEFARGLAWLRACAGAEDLSFVPGNHDSYVSTEADASLDVLRDYMRGDGQPTDITWPFVRLRRNVALIGLSSSQPQGLFRAAGTLGVTQRNAFASRLTDLGARGFYRVVLIHHPPLPGLAPKRKALTDAVELQALLVEAGVELVLHGHNHSASFNTLKTRSGLAHIVGVPSASMAGKAGHESAQWNRYEISRAKGHWLTRITTRRYDDATSRFVDGPVQILGKGN